jgi:hypothetical protein
MQIAARLPSFVQRSRFGVVRRRPASNGRKNSYMNHNLLSGRVRRMPDHAGRAGGGVSNETNDPGSAACGNPQCCSNSQRRAHLGANHHRRSDGRELQHDRSEPDSIGGEPQPRGRALRQHGGRAFRQHGKRRYVRGAVGFGTGHDRVCNHKRGYSDESESRNESIVDRPSQSGYRSDIRGRFRISPGYDRRRDDQPRRVRDQRSRR